MIAATPRQVFISYSSRDQAVAESVRGHLQTHGVSCWIATHDILGGSDWATAIVEAIDECRVLLLILSEASNQSDDVKREVGRASHRGIPIVPFFIEQVTLSKHMEYFLATTHWMGADARHVELRMTHLLDTVESLLQGPGPSPARPSRPAAPEPLPPVGPATAEGDIWRFERRFLDAVRPLLRLPATDDTRRPGPVPLLAAWIALIVGGLGVLFNLQVLLTAVAPYGPEAFVYQFFPLLRLITFPVVVASAIGNLTLVAGGHRMLSGVADGPSVTLAGARWSALVVGTWFVAASLITLLTGEATVRGGVMNATFMTGVVAAVQIGAVWWSATAAVRAGASHPAAPAPRR